MKLQKSGGEWKVVLDPEIDKADFNALLLEAQAASMAACATDIKAGKYKSADQAQREMMSAMMSQYMQSSGQGSGPANK